MPVGRGIREFEHLGESLAEGCLDPRDGLLRWPVGRLTGRAFADSRLLSEVHPVLLLRSSARRSLAERHYRNLTRSHIESASRFPARSTGVHCEPVRPGRRQPVIAWSARA